MLTLAPSRAAEAELFDKAAAALRRKLAAEPRDAAALARLGDVERRGGDFPAALAAYRRLLAVAPDDAEAAWAAAFLGGGRLPEASAAGRAAPFVRLTDFLPPAPRDRLLRDVLAARRRFVPAAIRMQKDAEKVRKGEVRNALVLDEPTTRDVRAWFLPKLRAVLPDVLWRLRLEDFEVGSTAVEVTVHPHGGFFSAHRDHSTSDRHRIVSCVCFFHREPRPFTGGDLLLHDAGRAEGSPAGAFSRIEPLPGGIVFFPGDCLHEITPVACGAEFGDGRFTVNGWVSVARSLRRERRGLLERSGWAPSGAARRRLVGARRGAGA